MVNSHQTCSCFDRVVSLPQEVDSLQELEGSVLTPDQVDALLLDLGTVLSHIRSAQQTPTAHGTPSPLLLGPPHGAIAEKARRLLAFACDQGWLAVAAAVIPLAAACHSCAHDIVAAIHASTAQVGVWHVWWTEATACVGQLGFYFIRTIFTLISLWLPGL